jgi:hypothetical protein
MLRAQAVRPENADDRPLGSPFVLVALPRPMVCMVSSRFVRAERPPSLRLRLPGGAVAESTVEGRHRPPLDVDRAYRVNKGTTTSEKSLLRSPVTVVALSMKIP